MIFNRKTMTLVLFGLFIVAGIAATNPPDEEKFKNLKILPKNISDQDLDKVMDGFKAALGVKCSFCHAPSKDTAVHHPDFASDAKPEKNIARKMMKMTNKINKKYFDYNKNEQGVFVPTVECMTCHRGSEHPGGPKK
jgi:Photosynthetic reaction centre cytochrome C subunit